ncbi:hypothetical protein APR12_002469 [Nocardia amikacinitolerans]|uniref:hypothetical protein n=1 Tax=Nocardia amikacinitolerans TaxID=756689 RepID=UPI000AD1817C|nr:hypothetical protein [Nocardia amikacinitolerans]MCP2317129.1 hypothetical protein [Nocardia amikacinitolerans]
MSSALHPLLYGYLRLHLIDERPGFSDERFQQFAHEHGFDLAAVFHETGPDGGAFFAMPAELRRANAHHVAVPSVDHLSGNRAPRDALISLLQRQGAHAWPLG